MHHRIMNDKLISVEKALLMKNSDSNDGYKHQIIGYTRSNMVPYLPNKSSLLPVHPISLNQTASRPLNGSSSGNSSSKKQVNQDKTSPHSHTYSSPASSTESLSSFPVVFSKLRVVLDCGRSCDAGLNQGDVCTDFYLLSTTSSSPEGWTSESNRTNISSSSSSSSVGGGGGSRNSSRRSAGDKSKSPSGDPRGSLSHNTTTASQNCGEWRSVASQRISSLVRSLDSVSAIIQSPLVAQPHE